MQRRIPVLRDSGEVIGGRVTLVPVVAVARILGMMDEHLAIPCHLGHDRRRRNSASRLQFLADPSQLR